MARASQDVLQDGLPAKENLGRGLGGWTRRAQGAGAGTPNILIAFVTLCKSFGWQQGIPTSDSLTPLGLHSKEPLVPTATA